MRPRGARLPLVLGREVDFSPEVGTPDLGFWRTIWGSRALGLLDTQPIDFLFQ